jgi:chemotaxis protein CheZ
MKLDDLPTEATPLAASPEVFQQIGMITRLLHDTLQQLGVMPKLQIATENLPDARSRLNYIAEKTASAADKVLDSVEHAKAEHQRRGERARWPPARCSISWVMSRRAPPRSTATSQTS